MITDWAPSGAWPPVKVRPLTVRWGLFSDSEDLPVSRTLPGVCALRVRGAGGGEADDGVLPGAVGHHDGVAGNGRAERLVQLGQVRDEHVPIREGGAGGKQQDGRGEKSS
ncbi:hypothetical protein [Nonomuraea dietziae]|uniref:hypothetical protein n=1 Tax=Nonomuraea dietziae TaxID=65515 RepID=UPI0031D667BF